MQGACVPAQGDCQAQLLAVRLLKDMPRFAIDGERLESRRTHASNAIPAIRDGGKTQA